MLCVICTIIFNIPMHTLITQKIGEISFSWIGVTNNKLFL